MTQPLKTALLLTGAAARISQEVALFDQLQAKKGLSISQIDTLLAGFSSGSLNLAAINACFCNGSTLNWDTYYKQQVLFPLRNKDVFKIKMLPFDTSPLRVTIQEFLDKMHCQKVGDLPFYSQILTFSWRRLETLWACSQDANQYYINLTDIFMASTAIPILFPSQKIHCQPGQQMDFPDGQFADGGTGGTFKRFEEYIGEYVSQNGPFDTLYIISPMRETAEKERKSFVDFLKENNKESTGSIQIDDHLENISMNIFLKFLKKLDEWEYNDQPMAREIYVCIPEMEKNFSILNFDKQKEQYDAVTKWIASNPDKLAIPLKQFLNEHQEEII
jgi:hypothetical protein